MKKLSNSKIGLLQALGVAAYCLLISQVFMLLEKLNVNPPEWVAASLMLFMLVFSVAIVGSLIFGRAVYLLLQKNVKDALHILGYTLVYGLGVIIIVLFFVGLS